MRVVTTTGFDLRPYAGHEVEQIALWVERSPNDGLAPVARLMYVDRRFVGGWVQLDAGTPARRPRRSARSQPASARGAYAEPLSRRGERRRGIWPCSRQNRVREAPRSECEAIAAPALVDLVRVLDRSYPTASAPPRRDGHWVVGFRIDDTPLVFESFTDEGLLVRRDDGYVIHPGAEFARLIGVP